MPLGSRFDAVEARLITIITARPALSGIQVSSAHPGELLLRESIWLDRVRFTEESRTHGQRKRDQYITAEIMVRVSQEGDDGAALRTRAYTLADEVEEALRADPNLNGAVFHGGVIGGEKDTFTDTDGRVCAIRLDAQYHARKG